jgi:hypothetical protein
MNSRFSTVVDESIVVVLRPVPPHSWLLMKWQCVKLITGSPTCCSQTGLGVQVEEGSLEQSIRHRAGDCLKGMFYVSHPIDGFTPGLTSLAEST